MKSGTLFTIVSCLTAFELSGGCAAPEPPSPDTVVQPVHHFPADHKFTLDELVDLSIERNASLDVSRYEAEAAQGLVDQVKALWLPMLRYDFAATAFDNDMNYRVRAFHLATINVPITGSYNLLNSVALAQIVSTGGKRTSGLKQAKMYAAIKKLDVLRQRDAVAQDVATYYQLVCLTNDIDAVIDDALRRIRILRQVSGGLNQRGSLRSSSLDTLEADFVIAEVEQIQIAIRAGRQQAYSALKQSVGLDPGEPMLLRQTSLPPAATPAELVRASLEIAKGFMARPENKEVNLFTKIRAEQVKFAKAAWAPNIIFLGNFVNNYNDSPTITNAIDGLLASFLIDVPIYDETRRGKLREALGLEQASLAFQRQVEQLITLEIDVTAIDAQKALASVFRAEWAAQAAAEHCKATRQAYSKELVPAANVVIAIGLDALAKVGRLGTLFNYHNAKTHLKRVTVDRESRYGY
ncbi:MAG TPA: TolC family protein [Phycisphaerae bacterium]|nr:TolC family protein [Phycisphaerae bacterium]